MTSNSSQEIKVGLVGAAPGTGNRGVSALGLSLCNGLAGASPRYVVTILGYGLQAEESYAEQLDNRITVDQLSCYWTRRIYRPASHAQIAMATAIGMGRFQPTIRKIRQLRAVLDVSGGDSFSDMYGQNRFDRIISDKNVALSQKRPLILLPQTYGPFVNAKNRRTAARIVREAKAVWARDERSLGIVRELLGAGFNPEIHKSTVDMAFGLPTAEPGEPVASEVRDFASQAEVLVGLNVSGLIYEDPSGGVERYKFRSDYRVIMERFLKELLADPKVKIVLVAHVGGIGQKDTEKNSLESDNLAIDQLMNTVSVHDSSRFYRVPTHLSAMELKWIIGQSDWFCGTRMHSCIAGLSQAVPTAAIAYSDKTIGVFETAGVGDSVVDPRIEDEETVLQKLLTSFRERDVTKETLQQWIPVVKARLGEFFEQLKLQIGQA